MSRITQRPLVDAQPYHDLVAAHGSPLLLLDCARLTEQYQALANALPNVDLFYAIKSLPHPAALRTLNALGAGFDIATSGEIDLLWNERIQPRRTIHTHPIKRDRDIRDALRFGCTTFIVDNVYELDKFVAYRSRVGLLLRVSFPNPDSPVDLSKKFGCHPNDVLFLLHKARSLGLHVKGLSFHAGSQCPTAKNHVAAIQACGQLIEQYAQETGRWLSILDIGGGFPVRYLEDTPEIDAFCKPIREALAQLPEHLQIIAEPGRYLSAPAVTGVASIMGKAHRHDRTWYYLDDGLYGSFSGQLYDHATYPLEIFSDLESSEPAVLSGPTCDSIDVIEENLELPPLAIGDVVVSKQMGAYTAASATDFNLFQRAKIVAINEPSLDVIPFPVELTQS